MEEEEEGRLYLSVKEYLAFKQTNWEFIN